MIYRYLKNRYYLEFKNKLDANLVESDDFHLLRWIIKNRIRDFSLKDDPELEQGKNYLGVIHELSHYYQDLSLPACISEHLYKIWYYRDNVDRHLGYDPWIKIDNDDIEMFNYIYKEPVCCNFASLINNNKLEFTNEKDWFDPINYTDLLESYAEMKAWYSIIAESAPTEENHRYIRQLLKEKNTKLQISSKGNHQTSITYNTPLDKYSITRTHFLLFLLQYIDIKGAKKTIPNTIYDIDYLSKALCMGFGITLVSSFDKERYNNKQHAEDTFYLMFYEARVLSWVLFALDVSLSIPTVKSINWLIKNHNFKKEDFHPCCRFYKVIQTIAEHPEYFSNLDDNSRWIDSFNYIAEVNGWLPYFDTIADVSKNNKFSNCGYIPEYQDKLMAERISHSLSENNCSFLPLLFSKYNIPIVLHFKHNYLVIRTKDNVANEIAVPDFSKKLMDYINPDCPNFMDIYCEKIEEINHYPAAEVFGNLLNMELYSKFSSQNKPFVCDCYWCKNHTVCTSNNMTINDVFSMQDNCLLMTHITIERLNVIYKRKLINEFLNGRKND